MIYITCPHCSCLIEILQINCAIFRHGVYKNNNIQIDPHLDKISCDKLIDLNLIHGCGKPFKIIYDNDKNIWNAIVCDYI